METSLQSTSNRGKLKFVIITALGLIMFLYKMPAFDATLFNLVIRLVQNATLRIIHEVMFVFLLLNTILSIAVSVFSWKGLQNHARIEKTFKVSLVKLIINATAALIMILYLTGLTPYVNNISSDVITMCNTIFVFLIVSKMLLPMVSDYGLAEFVEEILNPIMRPVFRLPGTAVIGILTSAFVSVTVAVMLITDQFYNKYFTRREALFMITCLTLPAMPITILLGELEGFTQIWGQFYGLIALTGLILSILMIRLPIFNTVEDNYYGESRKDYTHKTDLKYGLESSRPSLGRAFENAGKRASLKHDTVITHFLNVIFNMTSFIPFIIVFGTIAMFLVNETPIIEFLLKPYAFYLSLFGFQNATVLAPALFINTIDIVLPSMVLVNVSDMMTRMSMQVILLAQMVYMAPILLTLNIETLTNPLTLLKIFVMRVLLIVPIVVFLFKIFM